MNAAKGQQRSSPVRRRGTNAAKGQRRSSTVRNTVDSDTTIFHYSRDASAIGDHVFGCSLRSCPARRIACIQGGGVRLFAVCDREEYIALELARYAGMGLEH